MDSEARLVAVVDDDQPVRKALTRLLQSADYRAETYASGPEFVRSLAERMPACLVLDIRMQGMSGFDVQEWLAEQGVALPIVFITAVDDAEELALALAGGAAALLRKPFGDEEFLAAVRAATGGG
jgi:FixJ family two-component response regulator